MLEQGMQVGVVFGGRSVEHDVSIITGIQACEALSARHTPIPLYVDRHGRWFSGDGVRRIEGFREGPVQAQEISLDLGSGTFIPRASARPRGMLSRSRGVPESFRPDVVINATHGTQGEDGCLQGALELADLPYGGPNLESAALAMNKVITKRVLRAVGVPVLDDLTVGRAEYKAQGAETLIARAKARFGFPVYVKPASLGSSVGVSRCLDDQALADGLELAFELDRVALIEPAVDGGMEINCAVLGRPGAELRTSACEQPVASTDFLSFEDKYLRDDDKSGGKSSGGLKSQGMSSAQRVIPAPIGDEQTAEAQTLARRTFEALGCTGVARVDLLLDAHGRLFVNECNTIPGSFAFYLWEPVGLEFPDLLDLLIEIALAEHEEKASTTRIFESNLLNKRAAGGKA